MREAIAIGGGIVPEAPGSLLVVLDEFFLVLSPELVVRYTAFRCPVVPLRDFAAVSGSPF